jgi:uncharacterized RDD family membrane protein YckC
VPPAFQPAAVAPGPAPGVTYADLVTRIIAFIIDAIILYIPWVILSAVVFTVVLINGAGFILFGLVLGVIYAVGTAVYFVYCWTRLRASVGQRVLSLECVNAADGATLTQDQAIRRWAWLFGPYCISIVANYVFGLLGSLIGLLAFVYVIYLLYTVSQNPKHQGYHDVQASTVVVKRG